MVATKLHWVEGIWPGELALAARPRGGKWLTDEMASWRQAGVNTVYSLLTPEEEVELDLGEEAAQAKAHGLGFRILADPGPRRAQIGKRIRTGSRET